MTPNHRAIFWLMPAHPFFAAYGSLRRRSLFRRGHAVLHSLRFHGRGLLRGIPFIQNGFPGVVEQPGIVVVEIYQVLDDSVWETLDRFEGCDSPLSCHAHFYRKQVRLLRPEIQASVYFLGREIPRGKRCTATLNFAPFIEQTKWKISVFRGGADSKSR
jgi:gamma-glutamylcyclotransferase (GGCT)/AIG2-like uncharacterized protein YtfP